MAEYELWLDESGDFRDEQPRHQQKNASLVGGILVEAEMAPRIPFDEMLDPDRVHASGMIDADKRGYVLPLLERLQEEYGAEEVFFENTRFSENIYYETPLSNRQLYLRIIAEGLLQLMLSLNAVEEEVRLNVLIARRVDSDIPPDPADGAASCQPGKPTRLIQDTEYIFELKKCMKRKKKAHRIMLHAESVLTFEIQDANREQKLQLADFACNTRLTRKSNAFSEKEIRNRVRKLHEDARIFSMSETGSENFIKICLIQSMISDALVELYTTRDKLNRQENLELVFEKMNKCGYPMAKSQIRQYAVEITNLIFQEDDYESGEKILNDIYTEFVPKLDENGYDSGEFRFAILMCLAHMYLSDGDLIHAHEILKECEEVQGAMGNRLENLPYYYRYQEKLALYEMAVFQYEKAQKRMEHVAECLRKMMDVAGTMMPEWDKAGERPGMVSEYLGSAMRMQLYAMTYRQKESPDIYARMCDLAKQALGQYPAHEGERERLRQYQSLIEMEQGNLKAALMYLMQGKTHEKHEDPTEEAIRIFLDAVEETELAAGRRDYLMYYVLIMHAAGKRRERLAKTMHQALLSQKELYGMIEPAESEAFQHEIDMEMIQEERTKIKYHPMEVIYWKYGSFLCLQEERKIRNRGMQYLKNGVELCSKYADYLAMRITGLGIEAEWICFLLEDNKRQEANVRIENLKNNIRNILKLNLMDEIQRYVSVLSEEMQKGNYAKIAEMVTCLRDV